MTNQFTQEQVEQVEKVAKEIHAIAAGDCHGDYDWDEVAQWYLCKTASLQSQNNRLREVIKQCESSAADDAPWEAVQKIYVIAHEALNPKV